MNYMKELANILGVKLGEPFRLKGLAVNCTLEKDGLYTTDATMRSSQKKGEKKNNIIPRILLGDFEVETILFEPKIGDGYWIVCSNGKCSYKYWMGSTYDNLNFLIGNCFRTKEEAEKNKENILKIFRGETLIIIDRKD